VIMAGGRGQRLRPLTDDMPKPMLPVGGRPLMERIVEQLHDSGIDHIVVSTHYKPEKIVEHFGDGSGFAVDMTYVQEEEPLGTGGVLGLIPASTEPILVINGDILTSVDFRALHRYHQEHAADMTVGVRQFAFEVPYGVVKTDGSRVLRIDEKPRLTLFVNAGIYLVEPTVHRFLGQGVSLSMPDLIQTVIEAGLTVVSFPVLEYWIDIGRIDDYKAAQTEAETWIGAVPPDRRRKAPSA
jgi:NDP-sugar pyrophosphorylase family protein